MTNTDNLIKTCSEIKIPNASKYLRDKGWKLIQLPGTRNFTCFQKDSTKGPLQIDLPIDKTISDFPRAMLDACMAVAQDEGRDLDGVVFDMLNPMADIIRFHAKSDSIINGTLPVEEALSFFENAKKLLLSGAADLTNPKQYRRRKYPDSSNELVRICKFGQTEIGSYVVTLVCPLLEEEAEGKFVQLSLFEDEFKASNCFTRNVVNKVIKSISDVKKTIDSGKDLADLLNPESPDFVSINFMDGLTNMGLREKGSALEASVKWAPTVFENRGTSEATISNDYYDAITAKVRSFKEKVDSDVFDEVGKIYLCQTDPNLKTRKSGVVRLAYIGAKTGKEASAIVELSVDDYDDALEAHKFGKNVRVVGKMEKPGHVKEAELLPLNEKTPQN